VYISSLHSYVLLPTYFKVSKCKHFRSRINPFLLNSLLGPNKCYIKIYQLNKIYLKGVGLKVRNLSYSPPPRVIEHVLANEIVCVTKSNNV